MRRAPTPPAYDELLTVRTDGTVGGDLPALMAGRRTRVELSCRTEREPSDRPARLVITGTPPGVPLDETSSRTGTGVAVTLAPDADPDEAEAWLRGILPVTVSRLLG